MGDATAGQTPIDENESTGLLLRIRTQEALNRAEEENILRARVWAVRSRLVRGQLLVDTTVRRIHKEMFGAVWKWAGTYRVTNKNLGADWTQIAMLVRQLCDNFALRSSHGPENRDQLAVDFHHKLVSIHPFPNGNGRHARFCADRLVENLGGKAFEWGGGNVQRRGAAREQYLQALKAADVGNLAPLLDFSRTRN